MGINILSKGIGGRFDYGQKTQKQGSAAAYPMSCESLHACAGWRVVSNYSCAYSALACFRSGMSGSVSVHKERKLLAACERRMGHPS
jgi:hypothetical protein